MIRNRLIFPEGNDINFAVVHSENDETYTLEVGEKYYFEVKNDVSDSGYLLSAVSSSPTFSIPNTLGFGIYMFEVGIVTPSGSKRVLLPGVDERMKRVNELVVLRRL